MTLLATLFRRRVIDMIRYPFELVMTFVVFYVFFLLIFLGAKTFGGTAVRSSDTLSAIALGYVVFMMTQQSYQSFSQQLTTESTAGKLEQLALSPYGLLAVLLVDYAAQAVINLVTFGVVLVPIMATTGRWLHVDVPGVIAIVVPMLSGVVGLGLVMGGLAVVFKRMGGVAGIVGIAFLGLVAAPVERYPLLKLLPVAHGNAMLRRLLVDGRSAFARPSELLVLLAVSAGYVALGCVVFKAMERLARDRALLGQY